MDETIPSWLGPPVESPARVKKDRDSGWLPPASGGGADEGRAAAAPVQEASSADAGAGEAGAAFDAFDALDVNKDGVLTREEFYGTSGAAQDAAALEGAAADTGEADDAEEAGDAAEAEADEKKKKEPEITTQDYHLQTSLGANHKLVLDLGATLQALRAEIEVVTGIVAEKQKLFSNDVLLEGDPEGQIPKDVGPLIFLDTTTTYEVTSAEGGEFLCSVVLDIGATAADLKKHIETKTGVKKSSQRVYSGTRLLYMDHVIPEDIATNLTLRTLPREYMRTVKEVEKRWKNMKKAPPEMKNDREVVIPMVVGHGLALEYASDALKADREVVMAAAKNMGDAIFYASPELKADRELVLTAVSQYGPALSSLRYVPEDLKADKEVVMAAVTMNGLALKYAADVMQTDRHVALTAVAQNGMALKYTTDLARADRAVVLAAVRQNGWAYQEAPEHLKEDKEVVMQAVSSAGRLLEIAPEKCKADREVVRAAVANDKAAMNYAARTLQADYQFRRDCLGQ